MLQTLKRVSKKRPFLLYESRAGSSKIAFGDLKVPFARVAASQKGRRVGHKHPLSNAAMTYSVSINIEFYALNAWLYLAFLQPTARNRVH